MLHDDHGRSQVAPPASRPARSTSASTHELEAPRRPIADPTVTATIHTVMGTAATETTVRTAPTTARRRHDPRARTVNSRHCTSLNESSSGKAR